MSQKQQRAVDAWNEAHGGQERRVRYWPWTRESDSKEGTTRPFGAVLLGGHTPVVYVYGAGAIALTHVEVIE